MEHSKKLEEKIYREFYKNGYDSFVLHTIESYGNKVIFNKCDSLKCNLKDLYALVHQNSDFKDGQVDVCKEPCVLIGKYKTIIQFDNDELVRGFRKKFPDIHFANE